MNRKKLAQSLVTIAKSLMKTAEKKNIICDDCAAGLFNDDWSHLDYSGVTEEEEASILSFVEEVGHVSPAGAGNAGYFRCPCCGNDAIDGTIIEQV